MAIISKRIRKDMKAVYARRPATIKLTHRALESATIVAINTAALLSSITNRLPMEAQEFLHRNLISLIKDIAMARADYGGERDPPSLEALPKIALGLRGTPKEKDCTTSANGVCEIHSELEYHWYLFAENTAILQFSLVYFDKMNSVWEAFRARWGKKFLIKGVDGKMQAPMGSLTDSISEAARDGVYLAACASERFLSEYKWLSERDPNRSDLLEELKRRYEAAQLVAKWGSVLPGGMLEKLSHIEN